MWAYIKKAINTNLNKTLDTLITERASTTDALITNKSTEINNNTNTATNRRQIFTSNGTFTVPSGINRIYITACAAGGTGGTGGVQGTYSMNGGGGGGSGGRKGDECSKHILAVSSGQNISVTVGSGNTIVGSITLVKGSNGNNGRNGSTQTGGVATTPGAGGSSKNPLCEGYQGQADRVGGSGGDGEQSDYFGISFGAGGKGGNGGGSSGQTGSTGKNGCVLIEW